MRAAAELERRRRHNVTWHDVRRQAEAGRVDLSDVDAALRELWQDVKSDPLRQLPAAWLARALRAVWGPDFPRRRRDVRRWAYESETYRDLALIVGFDRVVVGHGGIGLYDHGNRNAFKYYRPSDFEALADEEPERYRPALQWIRNYTDHPN